jgi:hypothetical protein
MCHVVMDEAGVGKDAAGLRKSDETLMHRGHDLWLASKAKRCSLVNFTSCSPLNQRCRFEHSSQIGAFFSAAVCRGPQKGGGRYGRHPFENGDRPSD